MNIVKPVMENMLRYKVLARSQHSLAKNYRAYRSGNAGLDALFEVQAAILDGIN